MPQPSMPASVKVGPVTYTITRDPDDWMRIEHSTQTKGYYGHSNHHDARIYLNPATTEDVTKLTLWHEVLHAAFETMMGSRDWRHLGKEHDDREESIIRAIEAPTLTVLAENPELVAYLTS